MENGVQYEIINKNGEKFLATSVAFGNGEATVSTAEVGDVIFKNDNGVWSHPDYQVRDAESHLAPNGIDTVEDVPSSVEVPTEVPVEAPASEVAPETVE